MDAQFTILGGGIAGLCAGIALRNLGIKAAIFEASPEIKPVGAGLALAANAMKAFHHLGIADEVIRAGRQLKQFTIYDESGNPITLTDADALSQKHGISNFAIHRADLHRVLWSKLDADQIMTGKRSTGIETTADGYRITFDDNTTWDTQYVIAADGIHSPVRSQVAPDSRLRYAGYTCWRGIVDNTELQISETSETWGRNGRFGIVPLPGNRIYWFACKNAPPNDLALKQYKSEDIYAIFRKFHRPVGDIIRATKDENIIWNDICDLEPLRQYAFGNLVLIGDAAHATTPNMGQGACQAIEDAVFLAECLRKNSIVSHAFQVFEKMRLKRTHYIVRQSWRLGRIAQLENPFLAGVRNAVFRLLPRRINEMQLEKLYDVDFNA